MLTISVWKDLFYEDVPFSERKYTSNFNTMICLLVSIFTIPVDIILLPFEIITIIINFIFKTGYEKR